MRAVFTLFIAAALALSADASLIKRATNDPQMQLCMNDITFATDQLPIYKDGLDNINRTQTLTDVQAVYITGTEYGKRLLTAGYACCNITNVATAGDADALLGVVGTMVPSLQGVLTSAVNKKPELNAIFFSRALIKNNIDTFSNRTDHLFDTCLVNVMPPSRIEAINSYIASLKLSFTDAKKVYSTIT